MSKIYLNYFLLFILSACNTQLNYLGTSYTKTEKVDVFVDKSAIDKPYRIIGKGYINYNFYNSWSVEIIQQKAVRKAKEKGADAVLIYDYYVFDPGATINTVSHTDSLGKGLITIGSSTVVPNSSTGFNIIFLKYDK